MFVWQSNKNICNIACVLSFCVTYFCWYCVYGLNASVSHENDIADITCGCHAWFLVVNALLEKLSFILHFFVLISISILSSFYCFYSLFISEKMAFIFTFCSIFVPFLSIYRYYESTPLCRILGNVKLETH